MKRPGDLTLDDYYKDFCERYPKYKLTRQQFGKLVKDYFTSIAAAIIENNLEYRFPEKMGTIKVIKKKRNIRIYNGKKYGMPFVDWAATRKYWEENPKAKEKGIVIRHMNSHTNGYYYRYYYNKKVAKFRNANLYGFVVARKWKRHLAACLKDETLHIDFFEN